MLYYYEAIMQGERNEIAELIHQIGVRYLQEQADQAAFEARKLRWPSWVGASDSADLCRAWAATDYYQHGEVAPPDLQPQNGVDYSG